MKISKYKVVSLRYVMKNDSGDVLEDRMNLSPILYVHGAGKIIPALETAIEGMQAGESRIFSITPGNEKI